MHRLRPHTLPQTPNSPTRQPQRTRPAATRRPAGLPRSQISVELPELVGSAAQRRGTLADFLDFVVATPASLDSLAPSMPNSPGGRASPPAFELPTAETELRQTAENLRFHPCGRAGAVSFSLPPPYEAYACLVWVVSAPAAPSTSAAANAAAAAAAPAPAAAAAAAVAAAVAPHAAVAEPVAEAATELAVDPTTDPKGAEMKIEPKRLATAVAEAIGAVARAAVEGAMSAESASAAAAAVATDKAAADKAPPDRLVAAPASEASALVEATEAEAAEAAGVAEVAELPAATAADEAEEAPCRLALMLVGPRGSEPGLVAGAAEKESAAAAAAAAAAAGGAASGAASGGGRDSEGAEHDATAHGPAARRAGARQLATQLVEEGLRSRWAKYRSFSVWRQLNGGGVPAAAELAAFLSRLPTSTQLDALYPSLQSVRRLRLPWRALLEHLGALPLRPCRWRDELGHSQLLLLLGARGHLLHFSVGPEKGALLQMRACSMHRLTHRHELLSDPAESVATAVACWVWEQSMALLQKSNAAPNPLVSKGWTPRAHM